MNGMFGLNGILGYLLAVVLLLSILGGLQFLSFTTQAANAQNPYVITGNAVAEPKSKEDIYANLHEVEMISADPAATQARVK